MKTKIVCAVLVGLSLTLGSYLAFGESGTEHSGPVMNYHRVDDRLVTGGHLIEGGIYALFEQGVKVVIDVRDNSPDGEEERYAELGIKWINIPIEWRNPKPQDFDDFAAAMTANDKAHVFVQCAANYRASAMTYLYRVVVEGVPDADAVKDLKAVWDPDEYDTWREFINDIKTKARP